MTRFLSVLAVVLVAAGAYMWLNRGPDLPGVLLGAAEAQDSGDIDTSVVKEMTLGNPDAAVTVIEYASFTCPHCRNFHEGAFKELKAEYIDTGKINFVYREVYFDRFGLWAAMLARCGGSERYFGLADLIYGSQREWLASGDPTTIAGELRKMGRAAGLTGDQIEACLRDQDKAKAMVKVYQDNATEHGVRSTPSFLVDGNLIAGNNWSELKSSIDAALGG